jgi:hypothetical protein
MPKASRSTYHRLVRGSHSRWEPGVGTNPDTNLPNPGQRVVYVAGNPDYPDTMPNLTEAELATLGSRAQVVDGPPEEAEEGGEKYIAPVAKATTPVRPHDYQPRPSPAVTPLDRNRPAPAAPRDYSGISDLNAQDASKLVAEAGTAEEVEGLMAAEEASDKPRKTVLDAGERRLAQLKERDEDEE